MGKGEAKIELILQPAKSYLNDLRLFLSTSVEKKQTKTSRFIEWETSQDTANAPSIV